MGTKGEVFIRLLYSKLWSKDEDTQREILNYYVRNRRSCEQGRTGECSGDRIRVSRRSVFKDDKVCSVSRKAALGHFIHLPQTYIHKRSSESSLFDCLELPNLCQHQHATSTDFQAPAPSPLKGLFLTQQEEIRRRQATVCGREF